MIGYNIAHGNDGFSSHVGVAGPQSSNEFHSGESLNSRHGMQAPQPQSFESSQSGPVHHENSKDASSATILSEEMVQSKLHSGNWSDQTSVVPSASSMQKTSYKNPGHQHPFGLLLRDSPKKTMGDVSFPTIKDFKHFIEIMKSSFLIPGSDLTRHFQTAREMVEKEANAQNAKAEPDKVHGSPAAEGGTVYDNVTEDEVHSKPQKAALFEQSKESGNYQKSRKSSSVSDPVDSGLISSSVYDKQDLDQHSLFYTIPQFAAKELDLGIYGSLDNGAFSGEKSVFLTNGPILQTEDELGEDMQSDEIETEIPAYAPSVTKPLKSYGKSIHVSAPRRRFNISVYLPKPRAAPSSQLNQPTNVKTSNAANDTLTVHLPLSSNSAFSKSNLLPKSSRSHVDVKSSRPYDSKEMILYDSEALDRKQPIGSHYRLNVKPTTKHDGYLGDLPSQSPVSNTQQPSQTPTSFSQDSTQTRTYSPVIDNDVTFKSLPYFPPNSAVDTAFSRLFGNEVMSRSIRFKNIISDRLPTRGIHAARRMLGSFLTQQRRGVPLRHGYVGTIHAGLMQNSMQPSNLWSRPIGANERSGNMAYQPPGPLSASKVLSYTTSGAIWTNGGRKKHLFPHTSHYVSTPSAYTVKSSTDYVRGKVAGARKNRYTPMETKGKGNAEKQYLKLLKDLENHQRESALSR